MSVTFTRGQTTVQLPDPSPGYPVRALKRQVLGRTAGGTVYAYDKGVDTFEAELPFDSLTDAEKAALADFFDSAAEGGLQTFTYADSNGADRTARFLETRLSFIKVSANVWDVHLRLELSSMGT